jgi:surfeit locus 1 family protein
VQRKHWKDGLIAKIAARTQAAPIELPRARALAGEADREYRHVTVSGRLLHDKERYLYAPTPSGLGWHVFTPLETTRVSSFGSTGDSCPMPARTRDPRPGTDAGQVRITGLIRERACPGMFTPTNDVARNLWYWPTSPP